MNRGQITVGVGVLLASLTTVGAVVASYFTTINTQNAKAADVKEELVQQLSTETLARTTSDTQLQGELDQINGKLDAIINGLGIKYALPATKKLQ